MNRFGLAAVMSLLILAASTDAYAQDVRFPGSGRLKTYVSKVYGISIGLPESWVLGAPIRNEIWLAHGELRGARAGCFVRMTEVQYSGLSKPEDLFASVDERKFVQLNSIAMPDIKVHVYDIAYLSGRKARRVVYTGTDSSVKTGAVSYQAVDEDRTFTFSCFSEASNFNLLYNDFEQIISSFRFLTSVSAQIPYISSGVYHLDIAEILGSIQFVEQSAAICSKHYSQLMSSGQAIAKNWIERYSSLRSHLVVRLVNEAMRREGLGRKDAERLVVKTLDANNTRGVAETTQEEWQSICRNISTQLRSRAYDIEYVYQEHLRLIRSRSE